MASPFAKLCLCIPSSTLTVYVSRNVPSRVLKKKKRTKTPREASLASFNRPRVPGVRPIFSIAPHSIHSKNLKTSLLPNPQSPKTCPPSSLSFPLPREPRDFCTNCVFLHARDRNAPKTLLEECGKSVSVLIYYIRKMRKLPIPSNPPARSD